MSKKGLFIVLGLCFSLFMVHAQTEMYPGMVYVDESGMTNYVEDVSGTAYVMKNGLLKIPGDIILSTATVWRVGGTEVLVQTLHVPTWMGLGSIARASAPAHMTCATTYAENVAPVGVYYKHVDTVVDNYPGGLTAIRYVYHFEWPYDTVMLWSATTDGMLYAGPVNNTEPSSVQ